MCKSGGTRLCIYIEGNTMKNMKLKPKALYAYNDSTMKDLCIEQMSEAELKPLLLKEVSKMYPNEQFISELLKNEKSIACFFEKNEDGDTIFHKMALHNHYRILCEVLLRMSEIEELNPHFIDTVNDSGKTALYVALNQESAEVARILIMHGADIHIDATPSLIHAIRSNLADISLLLIEKNCDIHATKEYLKKTSLMWAIDRRMSDIAIELINRGVSVEERYNNHDTPLTLACTKRMSKVIRALLDAGANPLMQSKSGFYPHQLCSPYINKRFPELKSKKLDIKQSFESRYLSLSIEMEIAWKNILNKN